jgi:hypothetical protein
MITENSAKGNKVMNRLKKKSGPKIEALIWIAVFELQKGHASDTKESRMKNKHPNIFM